MQPLSVELGPGILNNIFDGIQRPLKQIAVASGDVFIPRGVSCPALDQSINWEFHPTGFKVREGALPTAVPRAQPAAAHECGQRYLQQLGQRRQRMHKQQQFSTEELGQGCTVGLRRIIREAQEGCMHAGRELEQRRICHRAGVSNAHVCLPPPLHTYAHTIAHRSVTASPPVTSTALCTRTPSWSTV